ncbi:hypothetical protein EZS27_010694 [termite gut metagenome]|jgi:hypothetical protein|uniref:Protein TolB n=1 Tax=termite gut metagenome TaxID=433724 RepID=A0A5J4S626_9ZZZZ
MRKIIVLTVVILAGILIFLSVKHKPVPVIHEFSEERRCPQIFPDYTGLAIPPNIAPLTFEIKEKGDKFLVRISGKNGKEISIYQSHPEIQIAKKEWRKLLEQNKNDTLFISIHTQRNNQWYRFQTIRNFIAEDTIDPYLVYRDIAPTDGLWNQMGMRQRNLESFDEYELVNNYRIEHNCMNCHTFYRNSPNQFLFHVRGDHGGTVFYKDGQLRKMEFPVPRVLSSGAYCNWHPNGRLVAFAVNKIKQNYYITGYERKMKEVFDLESDIVLYDMEKSTVFTFPQIASKQRENLPVWSADGRTLYFVSARPHVINTPNEEVLYSLMQVSYDENTNSLGEPEVLISNEEINGSISFPTVSPDGRFMFFCVTDFGYFPVANKSADIYLIDLKTNVYCKPEMNSDESESYISWSSNNRWFVFSSRRLDGMNSKPFICHIDESGRISKPFIIPQKKADYYAVDHRNFSRPELIKGRINLKFNNLEPVIFSKPEMIFYIR